MTIKQQGGIFGRNPKFNDVEATDVTSTTATLGNLNVSGNVISPTNSGDVEVDLGDVGGSGFFRIRDKTPTVELFDNDETVFTSQSLGQISLKGSDGGEEEIAYLRWIADGNHSTGSRPTKLEFGLTNAASGSASTKMTMTTNGSLVMANGQGIDFSATSGTGTSELFDDYEEGSHTVSLTVNSGTASLSKNILQYTKIGRLVHVYGMLRVSTVSSPSGAVSFTLPFTAASSSGSDERGTRFSAPVNLSASLNANEFELDLSAGTATVDMLNTSSGTISTTNVGESLQANTTIPVNITYAVE